MNIFVTDICSQQSVIWLDNHKLIGDNTLIITYYNDDITFKII